MVYNIQNITKSYKIYQSYVDNAYSKYFPHCLLQFGCIKLHVQRLKAVYTLWNATHMIYYKLSFKSERHIICTVNQIFEKLVSPQSFLSIDKITIISLCHSPTFIKFPSKISSLISDTVHYRYCNSVAF